MSIENGWFYENETMWKGMEVFLSLGIRTTIWIKGEGSFVS